MTFPGNGLILWCRRYINNRSLRQFGGLSISYIDASFKKDMVLPLKLIDTELIERVHKDDF
jgi:hypothetical protein